MDTLPFHEVATIFPLMTEDEFQELALDISAHGLREAIWLYDDQIIDGRNRYRACLAVGVAPRYQTWEGDGSLVAFVVSLNLKRRHLTTSQRAMVAQDILPQLEAEARERQLATLKQNTVPQLIAERGDEHRESREVAAEMTNTNRQYVSDAKKLAQTEPALAAHVRSGELTIPEAKTLAKQPEHIRTKVLKQKSAKTPKAHATSVGRMVKEALREEKREENRAVVQQAPAVLATVHEQRFHTLVLDPPWDWGDEGDADQFGRARPDYATMSIDQIRAMPVADLAMSNAHIYLWITNRSLPKGFALLEAWGFRYVTLITWVKPSIGMGNYFRGSTEQILFGVRGSLDLLNSTTGTWFEAKRPGQHSAKPDAFYHLVESCSPGPWLELFSRNERQGWVTWGERTAA